MNKSRRMLTKIRAPRSEVPKCPAAGVLCASRIHENTFDYDSQRPGRSWMAVKPGIMGDIPGSLVPHLSINNVLLLGSHFSEFLVLVTKSVH